MSNGVQFNDYSIQVKTAIKDTALAFLEEAGGELKAQTKRNCAVLSGKTKGSFQHSVIDGNIYDILLIDDPMRMHKHLEIYLKYVGGGLGV